MAEKDDERGIAAKLRPLTLKAKFGIGVGCVLLVAGKQKLQVKDSGAAIGKPPIRRESKSREAGKIRPVMVGRESAAC